MTIEATLAKLSYVMGKGHKGKDIEKMFFSDLRGEISVDKSVTGEDESTMKVAKFLSNMGNIKGNHNMHDLNSIAKMIQPMIACSASVEGDIN